MRPQEQCESCTRNGVAHDEDGRFLCEECIFDGSVVAEHYGDGFFDDEAFDYADPDCGDGMNGASSASPLQVPRLPISWSSRACRR